MTDPERLDSAARLEAMEALLAAHPAAPVSALNLAGFFVPMPSSIPIVDHVVLDGRWALDHVPYSEAPSITREWERTRKHGAARVTTRLNDGSPVMMHFIDVREQHGVFFALYEAVIDRSQALGEGSADAPLTPRFCSMKRDALGVVLEIDDAVPRLVGWGLEPLTSREPHEFIHPDDYQRCLDNWIDAMSATGVPKRWRGRFLHADGSWIWIEFTNTSVLDDVHHGYVLSEMADISDEMAAHAAVAEREQLLRRLTDALPLGVVQIDRGRRVVYTNDRLYAIVGTGPQATLAEQLRDTVPSDRDRLDETVNAVLTNGVDQDIEIRLLDPEDDTGKLRVCSLMLRALTGPGGDITGAIVSVADITESTMMRLELEVRATFDPLTHSHNRMSIMSLLTSALDPARQPDSGTAVIFIDLDRFKPINDDLGHAAGDQLLTVVADRLRATVRAADLVGRIGGDEFVIVCPEIVRPEVALEVAQRIADDLREPVSLAGLSVAPQASIGVGWSINDRTDAEGLVAIADAAMYESKRQGAGQPVLRCIEVEVEADLVDADDSERASH